MHIFPCLGKKEVEKVPFPRVFIARRKKKYENGKENRAFHHVYSQEEDENTLRGTTLLCVSSSRFNLDRGLLLSSVFSSQYATLWPRSSRDGNMAFVHSRKGTRPFSLLKGGRRYYTDCCRVKPV